MQKALEKSELLCNLRVSQNTQTTQEPVHMWQCTYLPRNVYDFLYSFKSLFRCSQARHFVIFCWLLVALIRDPGAGTRKGLCPSLSPHLSYWALLRMLRSGTWDAQAVMRGLALKVLRSLPLARDGKLYLIGDTTLKPKRGQKHPLGLLTRQSASSPYPLGCTMGVLVASGDGMRIPIALAPIDPKRKGHQNILFRQMLKDFTPPSWVRQVVVLADAGYAANPTLKLIERRNFGPKRVKIIVPTLLGVSAGVILSHYAVRWAVERTIKELKGGLHLGRMQVSQDAERVERSVVLPVCAYLL